MHLLSCWKPDGRRRFELPHIYLPPEAKVNNPKESIDDTCKEIIRNLQANRSYSNFLGGWRFFFIALTYYFGKYFKPDTYWEKTERERASYVKGGKGRETFDPNGIGILFIDLFQCQKCLIPSIPHTVRPRRGLSLTLMNCQPDLKYIKWKVHTSHIGASELTLFKSYEIGLLIIWPLCFWTIK